MEMSEFVESLEQMSLFVYLALLVTLHCLGYNEKQKKPFCTSLLMLFCCALTCLMYNDDVRSI
jgi:hypothetical protein